MNVLRTLAEAGPHEAPERVEHALKTAFRRQHRARRMKRAIIGAIATGAAAASVAMLMRMPAPVAPPAPIQIHAAPPAMALQIARPSMIPAPLPKRGHGRRTEPDATTEFVTLPYGDDSLVEESTTIVRVELSRSALRLAGFNVAQERADDRIQADVVLGADGLAHAVRFVSDLE